MSKTRKVWAIYYAIRVNTDAPWCSWVGPCGAGVTHRHLSYDTIKGLMGRPFFFRTRALARQRAKELSLEENKTWVGVKHTVRPFILTWTERN